MKGQGAEREEVPREPLHGTTVRLGPNLHYLTKMGTRSSCSPRSITFEELKKVNDRYEAGTPEETLCKSVVRGDDKFGNLDRGQISPYECSELKCLNRTFRAQIAQFELFELILLLKMDKWSLSKAVPCQAIQGSCTSGNSTSPP